jgi:hypothetical protein
MLATAQGQMSTAADAGALAGARQLFTENHLLANASLTSEISAAQKSAVTVATANRVLGAAPVLNLTSSADVVVGYLDLASSTSSITTSGQQSNYNAVQVRIARDSSHGGAIPTLFAGLYSPSGTNLSFTSTAVAENYQAGGFSGTVGDNANILPIALDQVTYNAMIAGNPSNLATIGLPSDEYSYNATTGAVTSGSDGIYESKLYPDSNGSPGNWGTVKIGVSNNSTSTLASQIQYGITPAQLATFPGSLLSLGNSGTLQLGANPGISAGLKSSIDAIIGQPRFIPIYSSVSGNGNNTVYTIVKFAGVRVMASNFQGNPKYVIVQPALVNDATAIPSTPESSWTNGGLITLRLAR